MISDRGVVTAWQQSLAGAQEVCERHREQRVAPPPRGDSSVLANYPEAERVVRGLVEADELTAEIAVTR